MSPQPNTAGTAGTPDAGTADSYVEKKIEQAKALAREQDEIQTRIAANRRQLRDMAVSGDLSAAQRKWVETFYPKKEKGERRSQEEIEATRKARQDARKRADAAAAAA